MLISAGRSSNPLGTLLLTAGVSVLGMALTFVLPEPDLGSLPPRGQAWEMTRYQAYQAQLAGQTIGETFGRAAAFLKLASPHPAAA